jgi:hypothetical protein
MSVMVAILPALQMLAVAQTATPPPLPYFGLAPSDSVEVIAPGFVSTGLAERDGCFTLDGKEFFYSVWTGSYGAIVVTRLDVHGWTAPEIVPFSGRHSDLEAFIIPDGSRLYFSSNRPLRGEGPPKDYDVWYVDREGASWSDPVNLGPPVNTPKDEFYPSVTNDGTLYVTGQYDSSAGGEDIYRFVKRGKGFGPAENLGPGVNSAKGEFNAFVDPQERYLLFSSFGRADQIGGGDLYVSWRLEDGTWGPARILGSEINSKSLDYCPWVTPDGRWLIFSSRRGTVGEYWNRTKDLDTIRNMRARFGNGQEDIYLFPATVLLPLR